MPPVGTKLPRHAARDQLSLPARASVLCRNSCSVFLLSSFPAFSLQFLQPLWTRRRCNCSSDCVVSPVWRLLLRLHGGWPPPNCCQTARVHAQQGCYNEARQDEVGKSRGTSKQRHKAGAGQSRGANKNWGHSHRASRSRSSHVGRAAAAAGLQAAAGAGAGAGLQSQLQDVDAPGLERQHKLGG